MTTLTFWPQAWVNDYAIDVDPQGDQTWEASAGYLSAMRELGDQAFESSTYESDEWRNDPAAPEWVREWQGPYWVEVHNEEE